MRVRKGRSTNGRSLPNAEQTFGTRIGIFGKLFGCWHRDLSRPFTNKSGSYRVCMECGARKAFDTKDFTSSGAFYYPPLVTPDPNRANS